MKEQLEQLLVKCEACCHASSTQHIIRQLLLEHRPPHWPPPLMLLSQNEISAAVSREVGARTSREEARITI
jgi:hypothetical protein